jgi:acyl-coenzyme A thioesterase PaaI-like protein
VMEGRVVAEAHIVRKGRQVLHGEVSVTNAAAETVAKGWCVYVPARLGARGAA